MHEVKDLSHIIELKKAYKNKFISYKISDELKDLCFDSDKTDKEGYTEYKKGLFIKNLTSEMLNDEHVSVFKIKATKDIEVGLHSHKDQSQTLYVEKGAVLELQNNIIFNAGQSYFVSRQIVHNVKYKKDTIVIVVYLPNLERI